ncbi:MAG: hypothetical protein GXP59_03500 [Deltaproteobacteria bacterium]|nr:hypothetical protein [Deltaproteobacteria bacterium]
MGENLNIVSLWHGLGWPLIRLLCLVSLGIIIGNLIESLNWTDKLARLARPLIRAGRLSAITGASFSMAFFSGVTSNTMLAEAYDQKQIRKRELVLANLFNSLPRYFLHLPTVFFLTVPLIGSAAIYYVGITFTAACFQTLVVVILGRFLLAGHAAADNITAPKVRKISLREGIRRAWQRFRRRINKIVLFTVPIYTLFFFASRLHLFNFIQKTLAAHLSFLAWLKPQALGIVVLQMGTEFAAGLAAAGALLDTHSLGTRDVVLALVVGNILSTPMRALRHQFPYYIGIFKPKTAIELIVISQSFRVAAVIITGIVYFALSAAGGGR